MFVHRLTSAAAERISLIAAAALAAALALAPSSAHAAADAVTWGITPSGPNGPDGRIAFDYRVAAGTVVSDWVTVSNESADAATFRVYAADAVTDYDTAAFTLIGADQVSTDLGAWTQLADGPASCAATDNEAAAACTATLGVTVTLGAGERATLPFTVTVPHDATPGDHSAGVVASYTSAESGSGTTVTREDRVGARIYLRVDGGLAPGVGVQGMVAGYDGSPWPIATGRGRVGFDVSNTGNTRISARPAVTLTGPFGIPLITVELEPVRNLVPGGVAHVTAELPGIPPLLLLFADVTVTPSPADGAAAGDTLPPPSHASALTWAVPWTLLAATAVVAALIWLILWRRRRTRTLLAQELADYADLIRAEQDAVRSDAPAVRPVSVVKERELS